METGYHLDASTWETCLLGLMLGLCMALVTFVGFSEHGVTERMEDTL